MPKTAKRPHAEVSFEVDGHDRVLIQKIAERAVAMFAHQPQGRPNRMWLEMDITACHANGNPLRLADLLVADDFNFGHDISGISACIDHDTGHLTNFFIPRFSQH